jgi:hypothetical protein
MLTSVIRTSLLAATTAVGSAGWIIGQESANTLTEKTLVPVTVIAAVAVATYWVTRKMDAFALKINQIDTHIEYSDKNFEVLVKTLKTIPCMRPRSECEVIEATIAANKESDRLADRQDVRHHREKGTGGG